MRRRFFSDEVRELFRDGNLSRVVSRCREIHREICTSLGDSHPDVAIILEDLGQAHFEIGDFEASVKVTEELLAIDRRCGRQSTADFARNLSNLGLLYRLLGRFDEALTMLSRALEVLDRLPIAERWEHPKVLLVLANLHATRGQYSKAEQLLIQAVHLTSRTGHPEFPEVFVEWSRVFARMGKSSASLRAIDKAIRIYGEWSPRDDVRFARSLAIRGALQKKLGMLEAATSSFTSALEVMRRVRPEIHPQISQLKQLLLRVGPRDTNESQPEEDACQDGMV